MSDFVDNAIKYHVRVFGNKHFPKIIALEIEYAPFVYAMVKTWKCNKVIRK